MSDWLSFGTDNCATHHIYNITSIFIGKIKKITNIDIRSIGGIAVAAGRIGTIEFMITNEDGIKEKIKVENVLYLPDCPEIYVLIHVEVMIEVIILKYFPEVNTPSFYGTIIKVEK